MQVEVSSIVGKIYLYVSYNNRIPIGVEEVFTFRITAQYKWLSSLSSR